MNPFFPTSNLTGYLKKIWSQVATRECEQCTSVTCSCAQRVVTTGAIRLESHNCSQVGGILRARALPFQPHTMQSPHTSHASQQHKYVNPTPGVTSPDHAARMEERIRAMAPFQTPPNSPSFRFVPPSFEQPERCGQTANVKDISTILSSTAFDASKALDADSRMYTSYCIGSQGVLTREHADTMISKILTEIPKPTKFLPSNMVLERGMATAPNVGPVIDSNGQYQGDRNSSANKHQVANLPNFCNCSLFLRGLPSDTPLSEFFDCIDTGAVYALHIMPPNGIHYTCAAKLTFMTPEGAAKFLNKVRVGICFGGYILEGRYNNREGYIRNTMTFSRVLFVEGPEQMMTVDFWFQYFRQVSVFQWDRVLEHPPVRPGRKCLEFRFARINGQAQTCLQQIQRQEEFVGLVGAWYGLDPCAQLAVQGPTGNPPRVTIGRGLSGHFG